MARQLEANLGKLEAGKPLTSEQQAMWAMLNAVDPAAANRLAAKHKQLPKLNESSPIGADPTMSVNTPLHLAGKANEVRTEIDAHDGEPARVRVPTRERVSCDVAFEFADIV